MNQTVFWQKTRFFVLLLLVLLITLSSHPTIVEVSRAAGMESGTILSRYIILVFALLFLVCFNLQSMLKPRIVRVCWFLFIFIVLFYMITFAVYGKRTMMADIRSIGICLVALMIGWQLDLDERRYRLLLLTFSGFTLFIGLMQVITNVGGFQILNQYHVDNKNSLGVMLTTSSIVFLLLGLNYEGKKKNKVLLLFLSVFTVVVLLTIRARAATLTFGLMALYIFYERYKGREFFFYLLLALFVSMVVFLVLPSSIKDFVYNSFFQNYEGGDITGGRVSRNAAALHVLADNIFTGNLNVGADIGWVHNYPLNRTFEFGIVYVLPIMLLYLYLLFYSIIKTVRSNNRDNHNIGYYVMIIPYIISMAEPTLPFGPGTATVFNFILFGLAFRYSYNARNGLSS